MDAPITNKQRLNAAAALRAALRPPADEAGLLRLHGTGLWLALVPLLFLFLAVWVHTATFTQTWKEAEAPVVYCQAPAKTDPGGPVTAPAELRVPVPPFPGGPDAPIYEIVIEPQPTPEQLTEPERAQLCAVPFNSFLGAGAVAMVILCAVLLANTATIGKTQLRRQFDHDFRRLRWPLHLTQPDLLLFAGLVATSLTATAHYLLQTAAPGLVSHATDWTLRSIAQKSEAEQKGLLLAATAMTVWLTLANLYVLGTGLAVVARSYPKIGRLVTLRQNVTRALAKDFFDPEADCVAELAKVQPPFRLASGEPEGTMPISTGMKPSELLKIVDLLTIPLIIALLAALAFAATILNLATFDPGVSDTAAKAPAAARQSWITLIGVAMSLAVASVYVPLFGRLKTYATAEDDLPKGTVPDSWTLQAQDRLVIPQGMGSVALPTFVAERAKLVEKPIFSKDLTKYVGADATKTEIILAAARHGGGVQHLLGETLTGSIGKFLGLLSPALLGGFLGLL